MHLTVKNLLLLLLITTPVFVTAQNVGIGTATPAFKLDVAGRLRLQNTNQTAGIWFDGSTLPTRSFIGTLNDSYVGIYGATAGWKFVMNVDNGNIGVGTTAPTATLDVNGTFRYRGTYPGKGQVLTSIDANGNADWSAPIAFRAAGNTNGASFIFSDNTWTQLEFTSNTAYNLGFAYSPVTSRFTAPEKGIYHFSTQAFITSAHIRAYSRLVMLRGGSGSVVAISAFEQYTDETAYYDSQKIDTDLQLEAGDIIYLEAKAVSYGGGSVYIEGGPNYTWFTGHLVTRL